MEGIWPLIVIWVLFAIFGSKKKRPPAGAQQSMEAPGAPPRSLPDQFRAALEELKRAEQEALRQQQAGQQQLPLPPAPKAAPPAARRQSKAFTPRTFSPKPVQGAYVRRPQLELEDDDADKSSEDTFTPEGVADYDDEAEKIIAARRQVAERHDTGRADTSLEGLSAGQLARRGSRPDVAIGGRQEHDAWHDAIRDTEIRRDRPAGKRSPLAKYADGTMRSALILSEILGKPKGHE